MGLREEKILRNTLGLRNIVGSLLELRAASGDTRPDEAGSSRENRRRKTYSSLWTFHQFLDHHRANLSAITLARRQSVALQVANTGRIVFRAHGRSRRSRPRTRARPHRRSKRPPTPRSSTTPRARTS